MKWIRVIDKLPIIPKGKYSVSVLVAEFDPCYDEINSGCGYSVNQFVSYGHYKDITNDYKELFGFHEMVDEGWMPCCEAITHWCYLPKVPKYDPEVLNPIFKWYHEHSQPQSPLKVI